MGVDSYILMGYGILVDTSNANILIKKLNEISKNKKKNLVELYDDGFAICFLENLMITIEQDGYENNTSSFITISDTVQTFLGFKTGGKGGFGEELPSNFKLINPSPNDINNFNKFIKWTIKTLKMEYEYHMETDGEPSNCIYYKTG